MPIIDLLFFLFAIVACCATGYLSNLMMSDPEKFDEIVKKWSERNPLLSSKKIASDEYKSFSRIVVVFVFLGFCAGIILMIRDFLLYGRFPN